MSDTFLSTDELAAKYPIPDMANEKRAWYRLIMRLRDQGKLKEGVHWRFRKAQGCRSRTRVYLETQVLKLLWNSDRPFCEEVRIQHRAAIVRIVSVVAKDATQATSAG